MDSAATAQSSYVDTTASPHSCPLLSVSGAAPKLPSGQVLAQPVPGPVPPVCARTMFTISVLMLALGWYLVVVVVVVVAVVVVVVEVVVVVG